MKNSTGMRSFSKSIKDCLVNLKLAAIGTLILVVLSGLFAFVFNPPTLLFMHLAAPVARLLGYDPPVYGFSSMGSALAISLLWPLTLAPLYWLNQRVFDGNIWGYGGLFLTCSVVLALAVLLYHSSPLS